MFTVVHKTLSKYVLTYLCIRLLLSALVVSLGFRSLRITSVVFRLNFNIYLNVPKYGHLSAFCLCNQSTPIHAHVHACTYIHAHVHTVCVLVRTCTCVRAVHVANFFTTKRLLKCTPYSGSRRDLSVYMDNSGRRNIRLIFETHRQLWRVGPMRVYMCQGRTCS
jgi:hypothetical protein